MCASALLLVNILSSYLIFKPNYLPSLFSKIRRVFFGCHNPRFGGCGSVLPVNTQVVPPDCRGYPCITGLLEKEAVDILQQFYLAGNPNGKVTSSVTTSLTWHSAPTPNRPVVEKENSL